MPCGNALFRPIRDSAPLRGQFWVARQSGRASEKLDDLGSGKGFDLSHIGPMPDNLAHYKAEIARLTGEVFVSKSGTVPRMPKKPPGPLQIALSARLRALQAELGRTDEEMAEMVKRGRTTWTNWVNAENMPEEQAMVDLCDRFKIKMEWLYRGEGDSMPARLFIRLELRLLGMDPDRVTPEEAAPITARVAFGDRVQIGALE